LPGFRNIEFGTKKFMDETVRQFSSWPWIIAAILTGFLISRLASRKKKIYIVADSSQRKSPEKPTRLEKGHREIVGKLWSLTKPIVCTYIGGEIYRRFGRMAGYASSRSR
jgi:hypothetical protein